MIKVTVPNRCYNIDGNFMNKFRSFVGRNNHYVMPDQKFPESPGWIGFDFQGSIGGNFL